MKKIIYCFVAALALVACTPKNGADQVIRIGVSLDDDAQPNQKAQQRITAVDGGGDFIEIKWGEDDVLYYQLDDNPINMNNPFKLISGAETKNAFFECEKNPVELIGQKFKLYYNGAGKPDGVIPTSQENEANTVNHDYLFYTATNCKLESVIKLEPKFALLGVQLVSNQENIEDIYSFNKYIAIRNTQNVDDGYVCKYYTPVNLEESSPIFYFVFPDGYTLTTDNYIQLLNTENEHNANLRCCKELFFTTTVTLNSNQATVIKINVERTNEGSSVNYTSYSITGVK